MWSTVGTGAGSATQQGEGVRWALDDDSGERRAKGRGERPGQRKGDEARLPSTPSVAGRATQVRRRPTSVGAGRVAHLLDDWDSHSSCPRLSISSCTPPPLPPAPHARAHDRAHTHAAAPRRPSGRTPHQPPPHEPMGRGWTNVVTRRTTSSVGRGGKGNRCPDRGHTHTHAPSRPPPIFHSPHIIHTPTTPANQGSHCRIARGRGTAASGLAIRSSTGRVDAWQQCPQGLSRATGERCCRKSPRWWGVAKERREQVRSRHQRTPWDAVSAGCIHDGSGGTAAVAEVGWFPPSHHLSGRRR